MKLGVIRVPSGVAAADPEFVAELGVIAENTSCESLWTVEHVVVPEHYETQYPFHPSGKMRLTTEDELPDPLIWMAYLAARTSTIKLGVGVLILPLRNPVVLAKQAATLDRLSGGRAILGLGLGWMSEEFDALGVPFERRGNRADEYLGAMEALWSSSPASFHGEHVDFTNVHCKPQPTGPRVPTVIGGVSAAAVRRAVRFGDGLHVLRASPDQVRHVQSMMRDECDRVGRDPDELEITAIAPPNVKELAELVDLGVARVLLSVWEGDLDDFRKTVEDYRRDVFSVVTAD